MIAKRVVLLDRDGTINVEREYLGDPEDLDLIPGATEGLRRMQRAGLGLVIVTNQSGVARGYFSLEQAKAVNDRLLAMLSEEGIGVDGIYLCPHSPDAGCDCRKPSTGMVRMAAEELGFDPTEAFVIGDKAIDMEMGRRAGATTIMVQTGYGVEQKDEAAPNTDHVTEDIGTASLLIQRLIHTDGVDGQ